MKTVKALAAVVLCAMVTSCGDAEAPAENCATITGIFNAVNFKADGTENTSLHKDFLNAGGTFQINLRATSFTSVYTITPGAIPYTISGSRSYEAGRVVLGVVPLIQGFATGKQSFSCSVDANTITLTTGNTTYDFGGIGRNDKAALTLSLLRAQ
jgi:hypothetical protein